MVAYAITKKALYKLNIIISTHPGILGDLENMGIELVL